MDRMVVRGGDDAPMRENEARDDGRAMCGEGDVFWVMIVHPACPCEMTRFE